MTHLHWDHVQGLPFFAGGDSDGATVRVRLPAQGAASPERRGSAATLLARSMSPPHFPIGPDGLRGHWAFEAIAPGEFIAGGCRVSAREIPHKGGRTFGYRVESDGASVCYLPDHDPAVSMTAGLELARGVDVLLHGGMYADSERATARRYGHGTAGEAAALATAAEVGRLVLVHHAPGRTDDEVAALAKSVRDVGLPVVVGHEGDALMLR